MLLWSLGFEGGVGCTYFVRFVGADDAQEDDLLLGVGETQESVGLGFVGHVGCSKVDG